MRLTGGKPFCRGGPAAHGLDLEQLVSEYRVLRAVVTRLWTDACGAVGPEGMADLVRFNEAIDQAVSESVTFHSIEVERWRKLFLATIGHDLRGPLNAMFLTSQALAVEAAGGPFEAHADALLRSGKRMRELMDSLLDDNRSLLGIGTTLHPSAVDLAPAIAEEVRLLRTSLPGSPITLEIEGDTTGVFDASRIREALANLVFNAAQYSRPGTPVRVRLQGDADGVRLTVANEGQPIEPEQLRTLFEPLHRGHAKHGERRNLGLGLFIVREIARAHGGDVTAEAVAGRVAFTIQLPR